MTAKLTRVTHKIVIQLHLVAEGCTIAVLAPGSQSRNFWIYPGIKTTALVKRFDNKHVLLHTVYHLAQCMLFTQLQTLGIPESNGTTFPFSH